MRGWTTASQTRAQAGGGGFGHTECQGSRAQPDVRTEQNRVERYFSDDQRGGNYKGPDAGYHEERCSPAEIYTAADDKARSKGDDGYELNRFEYKGFQFRHGISIYGNLYLRY